MTVIDTIITCALYMWNALYWALSEAWKYLQTAHTFFIVQPPNVQIALFVCAVLISWLIFVIGSGFHNRFLAVPDNIIWINTVRTALFAWSLGSAFHASIVFTGQGFMGFFEHGYEFLKHAIMFLLGVCGFILIGFAYPFFAGAVCIGAVNAIVYGLCLVVFQPVRIITPLEPSDDVAFRRAAGLSPLRRSMEYMNFERRDGA
jgi:hypothetical protein